MDGIQTDVQAIRTFLAYNRNKEGVAAGKKIRLLREDGHLVAKTVDEINPVRRFFAKLGFWSVHIRATYLAVTKEPLQKALRDEEKDEIKAIFTRYNSEHSFFKKIPNLDKLFKKAVPVTLPSSSTSYVPPPIRPSSSSGPTSSNPWDGACRAIILKENGAWEAMKKLIGENSDLKGIQVGSGSTQQGLVPFLLQRLAGEQADPSRSALITDLVRQAMAKNAEISLPPQLSFEGLALAVQFPELKKEIEGKKDHLLSTDNDLLERMIFTEKDWKTVSTIFEKRKGSNTNDYGEINVTIFIGTLLNQSGPGFFNEQTKKILLRAQEAGFLTEENHLTLFEEIIGSQHSDGEKLAAFQWFVQTLGADPNKKCGEANTYLQKILLKKVGNAKDYISFMIDQNATISRKDFASIFQTIFIGNRELYENMKKIFDASDVAVLSYEAMWWCALIILSKENDTESQTLFCEMLDAFLNANEESKEAIIVVVPPEMKENPSTPLEVCQGLQKTLTFNPGNYIEPEDEKEKFEEMVGQKVRNKLEEVIDNLSNNNN